MVNLTDRDQAMLNGDRGPAAALAMSILVRMAEVYGADTLMDISQAHIDSTIYLGDATLEFAEHLASLGARVAVPTSLNVSGVDECGWQRTDGSGCDVDVRAVPDAHAACVRAADCLG